MGGCRALIVALGYLHSVFSVIITVVEYQLQEVTSLGHTNYHTQVLICCGSSRLHCASKARFTAITRGDVKGHRGNPASS